MNTKGANRIWLIDAIFDSSFAGCLHGSPPEIVNKPCSGCYEGATYTTPYPILMEWSPGSDRIGDFSWPGSGRCIVKASVFDIIVKRFAVVRSGSVVMHQDPKLRLPKNKKRAKPRIWLPYEGPSLVEMIPEHRAPIHSRTTWEPSTQCQVCGKWGKQLTGPEWKMHRWDQQKQDLVPNWKAREPGKGLFISRSAIAGYPILWAEEFSTPIFCTDEFKHFIEDQGFTNIDFLEWGEIVDD